MQYEVLIIFYKGLAEVGFEYWANHISNNNNRNQNQGLKTEYRTIIVAGIKAVVNVSLFFHFLIFNFCYCYHYFDRVTV